MAYKNFISTVWSEAINRELEKALVFAEGCNRQYEGDVKAMGDTVRILGVGKPTITSTDDKNIILSEPETVDDASVTMIIKNVSHFHYKVDDIDKRQMAGGVIEALNKESTAGLANAMDIHIAKAALSDDVAKFSKTPVTITKENILSHFDSVLLKLYENDVTPNSTIMTEIPPWYYMLLKQAYTALDTNNSLMLENGRVGKYGNVTVKMSNNVAVDAAGASLIMVHTDKAIAFANPLTHTEAYRPEKGFSDAVKGFVLYQAKIVRPKELIVMNVKA